MLTLTSPCCFSQCFSSPHPLPPALSAQTRACELHPVCPCFSGESLLSQKQGLTLALGLGEALPAFGVSIRAERAQLRPGLCSGAGCELSLPAELGQAASWIRVLCQAELIWSQSDKGSTANRAAAPLCQLQPQGRSLPHCLPRDCELCPAPDPPSQQSCSPWLVLGSQPFPSFRKKTLQQGKKMQKQQL